MRILCVVSALWFLACGRIGSGIAPIYPPERKPTEGIDFLPQYPECEVVDQTVVVGCQKWCVPRTELEVVCPLDDTPFALSLKKTGHGIPVAMAAGVVIGHGLELYHDFRDDKGNVYRQIFVTTKPVATDGPPNAVRVPVIIKGQAVTIKAQTVKYPAGLVLHWAEPQEGVEPTMQLVEPIVVPSMGVTIETSDPFCPGGRRMWRLTGEQHPERPLFTDEMVGSVQRVPQGSDCAKARDTTIINNHFRATELTHDWHYMEEIFPDL
jgi:hypothetical protein